MQIGFIGLGKMGSRMASKLLNGGHELVVWSRSQETVNNFQKNNRKVQVASSVHDLVNRLNGPRIIWCMLPAGEPTETVLSNVAENVKKGDIVIDGGNSFFKDTQRRFKEFTEIGVEFLGIGVSGGIIAAKQGYPMMAGGSKKAYQEIKPLLDTLSKPNGGYDYFGEGGAGHYVKMIHNAIEYGYMQSIGEGFEVLEKSEYNFDLIKVAKLYQKNTLISGFMMDRTLEVLEDDPKLENLTGVIGSASGETVWTVDEAKKLQVPLDVIEYSLKYRSRSETDENIQKSFTARMVSALRKAFGGHDVKGR